MGEEDRDVIARAVGAPNFDDVPVYQTFLHEHDLYERIHVHLIGVRPKDDDDGKVSSNGRHKGIQKRRNRFGLTRLVDAIADPYVVVETLGDDTGSTDYFPIGQHKFPVLKDCRMPIWDSKCLLLAKKYSNEGVKFTMLDENSGKDEVLLETTLPRSDLPDIVPASSGLTGADDEDEWTTFVRDADGGSMGKGMEFVFKLKITDGADRIVSPTDMTTLCDSMEDVTYEEVVIKDDGGDPCDNALLQCWRHNNTNGEGDEGEGGSSGGSNKAVLWIIGRNDCFMHPHVARPLIFKYGYDLYVLNYAQNGHCRKQGWVPDAHLNSHNRHGNFDVYIAEIDRALEIMGEYETVVGYAHSTGGPVLINYLLEKGDDAFDTFIFNSPFLDWGFVGGDIVEFLLENVGALSRLGMLGIGKKMGVAFTPDPIKDTPISYLGEEIVLSAWSAKLWSLYHFDWSTRPLYKVPMTGGFAKGVSDVHHKMEDMHKKRKFVTAKPFLCITSRGDDVLKASETTSRADWIGPSRCEVELHHNGHDIFLSQDASDVAAAIDMVRAWMRCHGLARAE